MALKELIQNNRSCRRFFQETPVSHETLKELIDLARLSASGANLQPLKYIISCDPEKNAMIFPTLIWAGYLSDWNGPEEGERPSAYIVVLGDTKVCPSFGCDHGIAAQSILLGAVEKELAGCMIGSIHRDKLEDALKLSDRYKILLVLALGKPKEKVVIDDVGADGDIKYWRDDNKVHHVPKRSLDEVIIE